MIISSVVGMSGDYQRLSALTAMNRTTEDVIIISYPSS